MDIICTVGISEATEMLPIGRVFAHADVVEETSPGAHPICGDSQYPSGPTAFSW